MMRLMLYLFNQHSNTRRNYDEQHEEAPGFAQRQMVCA